MLGEVGRGDSPTNQPDSEPDGTKEKIKSQDFKDALLGLLLPYGLAGPGQREL